MVTGRFTHREGQLALESEGSAHVDLRAAGTYLSLHFSDKGECNIQVVRRTKGSGEKVFRSKTLLDFHCP